MCPDKSNINYSSKENNNCNQPVVVSFDRHVKYLTCNGFFIPIGMLRSVEDKMSSIPCILLRMHPFRDAGFDYIPH